MEDTIPAEVDNQRDVFTIRITSLRQLFERLDRAQLFRNGVPDLDEDFGKLLIAKAQSKKTKVKELTIHVHVKHNEEVSKDAQSVTLAAVCRFFAVQAERSRRELKHALVKGVFGFTIGMILFSACFIGAFFLEKVYDDSDSDVHYGHGDAVAFYLRYRLSLQANAGVVFYLIAL